MQGLEAEGTTDEFSEIVHFNFLMHFFNRLTKLKVFSSEIKQLGKIVQITAGASCKNFFPIFQKKLKIPQNNFFSLCCSHRKRQRNCVGKSEGNAARVNPSTF